VAFSSVSLLLLVKTRKMQIASKIRNTSATPIPMPALAPVLRPLLDEDREEVLGWRGMTEMVAVWVTGAGGEVEDDVVEGDPGKTIGEDEDCVSLADCVGVGVGVADGVEVEGAGVEEWDVVNGVEVVAVGAEDVMIATTGHCDVQ